MISPQHDIVSTYLPSTGGVPEGTERETESRLLWYHWRGLGRLKADRQAGRQSGFSRPANHRSRKAHHALVHRQRSVRDSAQIQTGQ